MTKKIESVQGATLNLFCCYRMVTMAQVSWILVLVVALGGGGANTETPGSVENGQDNRSHVRCDIRTRERTEIHIILCLFLAFFCHKLTPEI